MANSLRMFSFYILIDQNHPEHINQIVEEIFNGDGSNANAKVVGIIVN